MLIVCYKTCFWECLIVKLTTQGGLVFTFAGENSFRKRLENN